MHGLLPLLHVEVAAGQAKSIVPCLISSCTRHSALLGTTLAPPNSTLLFCNVSGQCKEWIQTAWCSDSVRTATYLLSPAARVWHRYRAEHLHYAAAVLGMD